MKIFFSHVVGEKKEKIVLILFPIKINMIDYMNNLNKSNNIEKLGKG